MPGKTGGKAAEANSGFLVDFSVLIGWNPCLRLGERCKSALLLLLVFSRRGKVSASYTFSLMSLSFFQHPSLVLPAKSDLPVGRETRQPRPRDSHAL